MTTKTITATFGTITETRTTEREYPFATFVRGTVAFHTTRIAAERRAGKYGRIVETATKGVETPRTGYCVVCAGEATPGIITERTATGGVVEHPCYGPAHRA